MNGHEFGIIYGPGECFPFRVNQFSYWFLDVSVNGLYNTKHMLLLVSFLSFVFGFTNPCGKNNRQKLETHAKHVMSTTGWEGVAYACKVIIEKNHMQDHTSVITLVSSSESRLYVMVVLIRNRSFL